MTNLRKFTTLAPVLGIAGILSACAETRPYVVDEPVGPLLRTADEALTRGTLLVYSAEEANANDAEHPRHTSYSIVDGQGQSLQRVANRAGSFYQDPSPVSLPPGNYRVIARAANFGQVSLPVVIVAGKTTVVHLDGASFAGESRAGAGAVVKLPNGQVVGWKVSDATK